MGWGAWASVCESLRAAQATRRPPRADCWHGAQHLADMQFVQDSGLASRVKAEHHSLGSESSHSVAGRSHYTTRCPAAGSPPGCGLLCDCACVRTLHRPRASCFLRTRISFWPNPSLSSSLRIGAGIAGMPWALPMAAQRHRAGSRGAHGGRAALGGAGGRGVRGAGPRRGVGRCGAGAGPRQGRVAGARVAGGRAPGLAASAAGLEKLQHGRKGRSPPVAHAFNQRPPLSATQQRSTAHCAASGAQQARARTRRTEGGGSQFYAWNFFGFLAR